MRRALLFVSLLLASPVAPAATVAGIVSERSAASVAAGARVLLDDTPEHEIRLRTPGQLAQLSDAEVANLWADADAVFLTGVFGDQVGRLARLLRTKPPKSDAPILAIHSDRRITRLSRFNGKRVLAQLSDDQVHQLTANPDPGQNPRRLLDELRQRFPEQSAWLTGEAYYQGRTPQHLANLFRWLLQRSGIEIEAGEPQPRATIRYYQAGTSYAEAWEMDLKEGPAVALLDLDSGDQPGKKALLDAACKALEERDLQCFAVLARWGGASVQAVKKLAASATPAKLAGVVSLQDFTVGGGDGRQKATSAFKKLDVPVIKGIRMAERTEAQWRRSTDGIPADDVHYKLAMPELQGISQPLVLSVAEPPRIDKRTGVRLRLTRPVDDRVTALADRMQRWHRLQDMDNSDKRLALIYYNHPPGRHNVGADGLDVPASLHHMLTNLKKSGYKTGSLPDSPKALLQQIQKQGVYLPQHRAELKKLQGKVPALSKTEYKSYFDQLPATVQAELQHGPVGYLHARMQKALSEDQKALAEQALERGIRDLRHMLEEVDHKAKARALNLLDQYQQGWQQRLAGQETDKELGKLRDALIRTGVPGLSGWGEPPGRVMVQNDKMLFPGLRFGNIFIGPQPPRGWQKHEELLHANTTFPPTHHYTGFYYWLREQFKADALVYVGRHSTREFLPHRRAGLTSSDYPDLLGGSLPLIYPYIVDGVGEGIQAKRRALGVMVNHLTPPLETTKLYDELLELRQLVETWESANDPDAATRKRAVERLRKRIRELNLVSEIRDELEHEGEEEDAGEEEKQVSEPPTRAELKDQKDASAELTDVDDELLVHEVGHYVTHMQERFMPIGLHVFGQDWDQEAVNTMLDSMAGHGEVEPPWRKQLKQSPQNEMNNFLAALNGRFVPPGKGNDPVRTPAVLPTGRNFHAISGDLVPTRVAWSVGQELASEARASGDERAQGSEAIVLWASDAVRDEGVMVAFGLNMLGIKPVWNSRGIVKGLERMPLDDRRRRDALFTTSGLFRDLYGQQLEWLDQAVRLALDGSTQRIRAKHPQLAGALRAALDALPDSMRDPGNEALAQNDVAARWVKDTKALLEQGRSPEDAGTDAALRVFGAAPGSYGAGVNRLAARSGAWQKRGELSDVYQRRMGHAYGKTVQGQPAHDAFAQRLEDVGRTYLGRASHVYGLLDNNDGFDFQGGLSMAVEQVSGQAPDNRVLMHADPDNPSVESLSRALLGELRGQNLNPQWLKPLMDRGYSGAREMSSDFLDNLWGWQVTNPEVVKSWVWDDVYQVYFRDKHGIGLDKFLEKDANVHVKTHMQAVTLVAAHRDYWDASNQVIRKQATEFAQLVVEHGLPGGGHTQPDHPTMDWVARKLDDAELRKQFEQVLARAQPRAQKQRETDPSTVAEIEVQEQTAKQKDQQKPDASASKRDARQQAKQQKQSRQSESDTQQSSAEGGRVLLPWIMAGMALLLIGGGIYAGRQPRMGGR